MERRVKGNWGEYLKVFIDSLMAVIRDLEHIKRSDLNLISIRDTSDHYKDYYDVIDNAGLNNLLVVRFDDLVEELPLEYERTERPPNEDDIAKILMWAKQKMSENDKNFIVHCAAGISRSSAVAVLIQYLQDPANALKVINPFLHSPNEKVLELGEKLLNVSDIKEPTKELLKKHDEKWMENLGKNPAELIKDLPRTKVHVEFWQSLGSWVLVPADKPRDRDLRPLGKSTGTGINIEIFEFDSKNKAEAYAHNNGLETVTVE